MRKNRHHPPIETDERFPTGAWRGFWLQRQTRGWMDLDLTFRGGKIDGHGTDMVGVFDISGRYDLKDGRVVLTKQYKGRHQVLYEGWAEIDKGIWGLWSIPVINGHGGWHIWPLGPGDEESECDRVSIEEPESEILVPTGAEAHSPQRS